MPILEDKVAIITGASSGLGAATARLFAAQGCAVVLGARRSGELEAVAGEIERAGGRAAVLAGDVQEEAYAKALVDLAKDRFGGLDIGFNNAGMIGPMAPASSLSLSDWNTVLATNLTSGFLGAKYQIPAMEERGGGSLIFTSTIVGHSVGLPGMAAYGASKAGLVGLTQVLAAEHGAKQRAVVRDFRQGGHLHARGLPHGGKLHLGHAVVQKLHVQKGHGRIAPGHVEIAAVRELA